jgi:DNA polymerase-3 subunit delta
MAVTYEKLLQSLHEKKFAPVYFLHGPEPYFIDYITDYIANNALSESERGFNQVILYGKDTDANQILNASTRYPLMSNLQVVIVKEAQNLKNLAALESYFEKPVPTTILVFAHKYKSLDKRLKTTKIIEQNAVVFESKPLAENKVGEWAEKYLAQKGYKISARAAHLISEYIGSDLEKLVNALDKLMLAMDKDAIIGEEDIQTHVGISKEYNVFELTTALGSRDIPKITKLANYIVSTPKENPLPMILGVLYNYFSKVTALYISARYDKEGMKALGIMEWFQKDYQKAAQTYGSKLKQVMKLLEQFDLRFKGVNDAGTEEAELVKELIFKIAYL